MQAPVTSVLVRLEQPGSHGERKGGVIEDDGDEGPGALAGMFPAGADLGSVLIAEMNPILMVVSSFRYGILGIEAGPVVLHLFGLIFCAVGLVILLIVMIDRRYRLGD